MENIKVKIESKSGSAELDAVFIKGENGEPDVVRILPYSEEKN